MRCSIPPVGKMQCNGLSAPAPIVCVVPVAGVIEPIRINCCTKYKERSIKDWRSHFECFASEALAGQ